jgi:hypothetical protein
LPILNSVDVAEWTEISLHFDIVYTVQKFGAFFTTVADTSRALNLPGEKQGRGTTQSCRIIRGLESPGEKTRLRDNTDMS